MLYRIRFQQKDERGRERQLAATTKNFSSLTAAVKFAAASLERTDPATLEKIVGIRIGPWIEPASAEPAPPPLALEAST